LRFSIQEKSHEGLGAVAPNKQKSPQSGLASATQISESMLASQKKSKKSKMENVNQTRNQKNTKIKKINNQLIKIKNTN